MVRAIDTRAPQTLHDRVEALVAGRARSRRRRRTAMRWSLFAGAPALAAVLVVVLVASLSAGGGSSLTLGKTVALTLRAATMPAPAEDPRNATALMVSVDGVSFPYWEGFGFRATGMRVDRAGDRSVTTVFYTDHKHWIGYAIVGGTPAPTVSGGVVVRREGTPYRLTSEDGAKVVTWLRAGRLCVVAGHGVSSATLLSLASWRGRETLPA
jgi:hypothetical protein